MSFALIGPTKQVSIDFCDELLFEVAGLAGIRGPLVGRLWKDFDDNPSYTPEEAGALADELKVLVNPRPRPGDLEAKCEELLAVCEDAARHGCGLRSLSD